MLETKQNTEVFSQLREGGFDLMPQLSYRYSSHSIAARYGLSYSPILDTTPQARAPNRLGTIGARLLFRELRQHCTEFLC
jgi:hypothetical protein